VLGRGWAVGDALAAIAGSVLQNPY